MNENSFFCENFFKAVKGEFLEFMLFIFLKTISRFDILQV